MFTEGHKKEKSKNLFFSNFPSYINFEHVFHVHKLPLRLNVVVSRDISDSWYQK